MLNNRSPNASKFKLAVLLAGPSASGKSTLARALGMHIVSTSARLRALLEEHAKDTWGDEATAKWGWDVGKINPDELFRFGQELDRKNPHWLEADALEGHGMGVVFDAVRSQAQEEVWSRMPTIKVNVACGEGELERRHRLRGTSAPQYVPFAFKEPDFVWRSDLVPVAHAVQAIRYMTGGGYADVVIGAQYGSEGKGKLCSLLSPGYDVLVRSGGPNAGHWVRVGDKKYCFHSIPSGVFTNGNARVMIAAGAALNPDQFLKEVSETGCAQRLLVDRNAVNIVPTDSESEAGIVNAIGSTGQGVGAALCRRIARKLVGYGLPGSNPLTEYMGSVSFTLSRELHHGARVMIEGTQGSGLSLFHGPYPFTTSRDTNLAGLLSEVGIAPTWVRDVWLVVRSLPIRTGGNSGPLKGEMDWGRVENRLGMPSGTLKERERTSTTNRIRRVGEFDTTQFEEACWLNSPTKLFLTFADYINPNAAGVRDWDKLPADVVAFAKHLEEIAHCPVVGVSTGPDNSDVAWRPGEKVQ